VSKGAFATFGLCKNLLRAISEAGFVEPRPIQAKTIPQVLEGRDVLGLAQTGTGKTAAFALPIIERILARRGNNPRALILAPTRELAMQIHAEIELLAKYTNIRAITVFGGVGAAPQIRALQSRPQIIVACPGRLLDLLGSGAARLEGVEVLVLDEGDHMLDMGFLPDIKRIMARLPSPRQNLLFSATMPREIRTLTSHMLRDPHVVELAHSAPLNTIEHALYPVERTRKTALLRHLLAGDDFKSAIVFLRTKHRTRRLAQDLDRAGHRAIALQGNMSQSQRQRAMQGFREGRYDVLVATDIAARGIDVAHVSHVINFDIPNTPDAYTHRIGRTGRSERSGKAYTFVTHEDLGGIKDIERKLKMEIPRVKLEEFQLGGGDETLDRREQGRTSRGAKQFSRRPGAAPRRGPGGQHKAHPKPGRPGKFVHRNAPSKPVESTAGSSFGVSFGAGIGAGMGAPAAQGNSVGSGSSKRARRRKRMESRGASSESSGDSGARSGKGVRRAKNGSGSRPKGGGKQRRSTSGPR
jgi:ATP-dependent RNA helicase RhlE